MNPSSLLFLKPQVDGGFIPSVLKTLQCFIVVFSSVWLFLPSSYAQIGVHQTLDDFLIQNFTNSPNNETLWLNDQLRSELSEVLGRSYRGIRIRYWRDEERTAWILNEIGKERPITSGIVVEDGRIMAVTVLEYRESRGGEVRLPSFRQQFINAGLNEKGQLNQQIDGITGATMSVRTLNRSSIAALRLHKAVTDESSPK